MDWKVETEFHSSRILHFRNIYKVPVNSLNSSNLERIDPHYGQKRLNLSFNKALTKVNEKRGFFKHPSLKLEGRIMFIGNRYLNFLNA